MKTRMALIGPGDVAQRDYLPEFQRIADRAQIVDVCGHGEARARDTAARFGARWHTDYRQMLAQTTADMVLNLTPIQLHAEVTLAAIAAGKHVFSEKPVAGSAVDAVKIARAADAAGVIVVAAPSVMLFPQVRHVCDLLAQDAIGPVHFARGRGWGGLPPWGGYSGDPAPFFARGGGPLRDMAVYPLHVLTGLLGPVLRVTALSARVQTAFTPGDGLRVGQRVPVEEPDLWSMVLDFGNSRIASLESNNAAHASRAPELELFGMRGTIAMSLIDVGAPVEIMKAEGDWSWRPSPHANGGRAAGPDHLLGVIHLLDCLRDGAQPVLSLRAATHVLAVIDAAYESAREGRVAAIKDDLT